MPDKVVNIKTGKAPQKNERAKRGQDAKRWKWLYNELVNGVADLYIAGTKLSPEEVEAFIAYIDEQIKLEYNEKKKEEIRQRRNKSS